MRFIAEMTGQFRWITNLPAGLESAAALWIIVGVYLALLLAGSVIDIVLGVRLLNQPMDWVCRIERLKGRTWTWREAGWMAIILLTAQLAIHGIRWILVERDGASMNSDTLAVLCQGMAFHGVGLAALAWSIHRRRVSWSAAFGIRWGEAVHRVRQGVVCYLGILPMVFVTSLVYQLILFFFGYPLSIQNVVLFFLEPPSVSVQVFLLVLALVIAPMTEEALFRGIALPLLARAAGVIPAVALTSACFALIHFHVPSLAPLFVLAAGFAVAYIVTESLWVPIIMHALFNGMNIGLLLLATPR